MQIIYQNINRCYWLILCLLMSMAAHAYEGKYNFRVDSLYFSITSATSPAVEIVGCGSGVSGDMVVPSTVSHNDTTYTITSIGNRAFL